MANIFDDHQWWLSLLWSAVSADVINDGGKQTTQEFWTHTHNAWGHGKAVFSSVHTAVLPSPFLLSVAAVDKPVGVLTVCHITNVIKHAVQLCGKNAIHHITHKKKHHKTNFSVDPNCQTSALILVHFITEFVLFYIHLLSKEFEQQTRWLHDEIELSAVWLLYPKRALQPAQQNNSAHDDAH